MPEAPILGYDHPNPIPDRRSKWMIPGYCAGVLAMGLAYDIVGYAVAARHYPDMFPRIIYGLIYPIAFAFVSLLPQTIFLGIALWLKRKIVKEVRFGGLRPAFLWGILGGLAPWGLTPLFQEFDFQLIVPIYFGCLGWFVVVPAIAGCFLCYRWHLRD